MTDTKHAHGLWRLLSDVYPDASPVELLRLIFLVGKQDRKDCEVKS